ncbi:von Willebrand factor A domain-containing protein 7, partial [Alligator sinensis]|uniref:von Willebrand factor A domain-containing protein 7 n=1 Tax=Alligator sinensis TaxID=38654 RepID=A0A1U8DJP2_ALLSI
AFFLEKHPRHGKAHSSPGSLEKLDPLTASSLIKAYYGADVSASRLDKVLDALIAANNQVEAEIQTDPAHYFYCEEIAKGQSHLQAYRKTLLDEARKEGSMDGARVSAGKALHILQKFYSNSNWVEMGRGVPYEHLGMGGCEGGFLCKDNLLVTDMLTSGYRSWKACGKKPPGKCSHGTPDDITSRSAPTGGINKETWDPVMSPHHDLHLQAARLAIQATRDFFVAPGYGFLDKVGETAFRSFFNLATYSLTFVVDTTGSMSEEIAWVKDHCLELLHKYAGSPDAPHNYVLVPFSDPDFGPVFVTENVKEFQVAIEALTVSGGDDCPEMALSGLELALRASEPRSKIFTFTDASAKDIDKMDVVKMLVESKGSQVNPLLTGVCHEDRAIREAPRPFTNVFEELAWLSGGFYVLTTKAKLPELLGVMELALNAAPVTVIRGRLRGDPMYFSVDDALSEFTVSIRSLEGARAEAFSLTLQQPSGTAPPDLTTVIASVDRQVVKVPRVAETGMWKLTVVPSGYYEVEVGGKSLLDINIQLLEGTQDLMLPIQGRPVQGGNYTVSVRLQGEDLGARPQRLVILDSTLTPVDAIPLVQRRNAQSHVLGLARLSLHHPVTILLVEGQTGTGVSFSRLHPTPVTAAAVLLAALEGQNTTLHPGDTTTLQVQVSNSGPEDTFSFSVRDELGLLQSFEPSSVTLASGESLVLYANFTAPKNFSGFASSIATFSARGGSAQNYIKVPLIAVPEAAQTEDVIPPTHKLLGVNFPCVKEDPDCTRHNWTVRFSVTDDQGPVTIQVVENPRGLTCRLATSGGQICVYRSTCCSQVVQLLFSDRTGNADTLVVDYRNPDL